MNLTKDQLVFGIPKTKDLSKLTKEEYPNDAVVTLKAKDYSKAKVASAIRFNPKAIELLGITKDERHIDIVSSLENGIIAFIKGGDQYKLGVTTNSLSNSTLYETIFNNTQRITGVSMSDTVDNNFLLTRLDVEDLVIFNLSLINQNADSTDENTSDISNTNDSETIVEIPEEEEVETSTFPE